MVYRKFTLDVRLPMGEYARCNPDPQTGVFSCSSGSGGGSGLPKSCGSHYDEHHSRFLNGTFYNSLALPTNGSLAGCCAYCTADARCDAGRWGPWGRITPTATSSATGRF